MAALANSGWIGDEEEGDISGTCEERVEWGMEKEEEENIDIWVKKGTCGGPFFSATLPIILSLEDPFLLNVTHMTGS